jgi:hypothetical protein
MIKALHQRPVITGVTDTGHQKPVIGQWQHGGFTLGAGGNISMAGVSGTPLALNKMPITSPMASLFHIAIRLPLDN